MSNTEQFLQEISEEDQAWLHYNPNTSDIVEYVKEYARQAIAAALSAQSAVQAQVEATLVHRDWKRTIASNPVMVLYTDSINDEQVCRDDLWIATTSQLKDTHPSSAAQAAEIRNAALTPKQIEAGWHKTFSTSNPYCPCDLKSFDKAVQWALRELQPTPAVHAKEQP